MEAPKPVVQTKPTVVPIDEKSRVDLLLAFSRKRAADAEYRAAQLTMEHLIRELDKDGLLMGAIQNVQVAGARAQEASTKMSGVIIEVQKEVGYPLDGYHIDPDSGNLIKPPPALVPEAKVIDLKPAKRKRKK